MRARSGLLTFLFAVLLGAVPVHAQESPLLLQRPTLSKTEIAFSYGGYLWSVPRTGGDARQLTTGGRESTPVFSPDGKWIAFTGEYDGNVDVFVIPAEGGSPKRLTWHPGDDVVIGWTQTARRSYFDLHVSRLQISTACTLCRWKAACPKYCQCGGHKREPTRPTGLALLMYLI